MSLGIVFGQAFLVSFTDHEATVGALPEVNLPTSIAKRRSVYDRNVLQKRRQRRRAYHYARALGLGNFDIGFRRQLGGVGARGDNHNVGFDFARTGLNGTDRAC